MLSPRYQLTLPEPSTSLITSQLFGCLEAPQKTSAVWANHQHLCPRPSDELLALNDALDQLTLAKAQAAELVKLRFFAGLTNEDAAASMGVSPRKANQIWAYSRAWLLECLGHEPI